MFPASTSGVVPGAAGAVLPRRGRLPAPGPAPGGAGRFRMPCILCAALLSMSTKLEGASRGAIVPRLRPRSTPRSAGSGFIPCQNHLTWPATVDRKGSTGPRPPAGLWGGYPVSREEEGRVCSAVAFHRVRPVRRLEAGDLLGRQLELDRTDGGIGVVEPGGANGGCRAGGTGPAPGGRGVG